MTDAVMLKVAVCMTVCAIGIAAGIVWIIRDHFIQCDLEAAEMGEGTVPR